MSGRLAPETVLTHPLPQGSSRAPWTFHVMAGERGQSGLTEAMSGVGGSQGVTENQPSNRQAEP